MVTGSLRCGGQRRRRIGQSVKIVDQVGALGILGDAGERHVVTRDETLRIGEIGIEVVEGPLALLALVEYGLITAPS